MTIFVPFFKDTLYSARVWNREIGFFVNQTWLNRGKIWYDTPDNTVNHVDSMDRERAYLRQMIKTEIDREAGAFELIQQQALASLSAGIDRADFEVRQARDAKKFYKEG